MFLKNKIARNAGWIILCRIIQAVLNLVVTMMTARLMGPSNYGLINYAASVVAFAVPVMQLGLDSILVQLFVTEPDRDGEIVGTSYVLCSVSALLSMLGVAAFVAVSTPGETETLVVCVLYSLILIFQAFELVQYWFQAKYLSKYTSIAMLAAYFVVAVYKIVLLLLGCSIYWFAIAQAIDYLIIAVALFVIFKRLGGGKLRFSLERARSMLSKSRYYIVSSMMVTVFAQTDKIMLKLMLGDEATGYYSTAAVCAGMTAFVFAAIIDSARPAILGSYGKDTAAFEKNVSRLYSVIIYLSLLQCVGMTVFADLIIGILYGSEYALSVLPLRIIVWYTTFSYLGAVRNVWILAESRQKYLWIINLSGALCNVALNFALIPLWGVPGAAAASLITQIVTNVFTGFIIKPIRKNNILMLRGLNPKLIVEMIKTSP